MTGGSGDYLDGLAGHEARTGRTSQENRVRAVTSIGRLAGAGRVPGSRVIAFATYKLRHVEERWTALVESST